MSKPLLKVDNLKKHFPITGGIFNREIGKVKAVDGISFTLYKGETLSIVGESGCGKSTTGKMLLRLIEPTDGSIIYKDIDLMDISNEKMRDVRKDLQMIFQDPYASLNPRYTVRQIIEEPMKIHKLGGEKVRKQKLLKLLETVDLEKYHLNRYPHEFSGGQRQRIGIARALAVNPEIIVADEPVSALDVSVQSKILNLMKNLQSEFNLSYIFIAHDLGVIRHISDRIAVMYLGHIVELADVEDLYKDPRHPYTQSLLSSVPIPDPEAVKDRTPLEGDVPDPSNPPKGCVFHTRCPFAMEICKTDKPVYKEVEHKHFSACHLDDVK